LAADGDILGADELPGGEVLGLREVELEFEKTSVKHLLTCVTMLLIQFR
jgi:hypothetical protein